ncbi:hypothetical protein HDU98_009307, partial [Podochytrium sp. JEL0797]
MTVATDSTPIDVPSTPLYLAIGCYAGLWLVSLVAVFVFTRRESTALRRDIGGLRQRLLAARRHDEALPRHKALVVPSTPDTTGLVLALAQGDEVPGLDDAALALGAFAVDDPEHKDALQIASNLHPHKSLLLHAKAIPRIPGLCRRMLNISSAKFNPKDIDQASNHQPGSTNHARFVSPKPPVSPLAQRVHRLILASIEADLKVLEARFKRDAVRYPPIVFTFIGFQLLAIFLFLFGSGLKGWPAGLPTLLLVACSTLGLEILVAVLIRDLLTDLKAERAVLILSLTRVQSRFPYHLTFHATTYTHAMSPADYLLLPFLAPFCWWAVPLAKRALLGVDEKGVGNTHVEGGAGVPRSLGGGVLGGDEEGGREVEGGWEEVKVDDNVQGGEKIRASLSSSSMPWTADSARWVILNGTLRPTVWHVRAELRVPKSGGDEGTAWEAGCGETGIVV